MARRKKELPLLEQVEILSTGKKGKAVAKNEGLVVFVEGAVPGDVCDVKLFKKRKNRAEGRMERLVSRSPHRVEPKCQHFGTCGGCKWQHLDYRKQLEEKAQHVLDSIERLAQVEHPVPLPIIGSEKTYRYRNKLEFTFGAKRWLTVDEIQSDNELDKRALGYHIAGNFEKILHVETCHLQQEPTNEIRNFIDRYARENELSYYDIRANEGLLRNLTIRISRKGEFMILVSFGRNEEENIKKTMYALEDRFPACSSLLYVVNLKKNDTIWDQDIRIHKGQDHINEHLHNGNRELRFRVGAKSFFQTNPSQAEILYSKAVELAELSKEHVVYDLYCGAGSIALFLADSVKKVTGIEIVPEAVRDAKLNKEINQIKNVEFHEGDMKDVFKDSFIAEHGKPDVVVLDPPRAGLHPDVVKQLLKLQPPRIIYISCDPATQARDIGLMDERYKLTAIQPVDMFPHTHHIENIVRLDLR